jgi:hypothetical protein
VQSDASELAFRRNIQPQLSGSKIGPRKQTKYCTQKIILKLILNTMEGCRLDSSGSEYGSMTSFCENSNEPEGSIILSGISLEAEDILVS